MTTRRTSSGRWKLRRCTNSHVYNPNKVINSSVKTWHGYLALVSEFLDVWMKDEMDVAWNIRAPLSRTFHDRLLSARKGVRVDGVRFINSFPIPTCRSTTPRFRKEKMKPQYWDISGVWDTLARTPPSWEIFCWRTFQLHAAVHIQPCCLDILFVLRSDLSSVREMTQGSLIFPLKFNNATYSVSPR